MFTRAGTPTRGAALTARRRHVRHSPRDVVWRDDDRLGWIEGAHRLSSDPQISSAQRRQLHYERGPSRSAPGGKAAGLRYSFVREQATGGLGDVGGVDAGGAEEFGGGAGRPGRPSGRRRTCWRSGDRTWPRCSTGWSPRGAAGEFGGQGEIDVGDWRELDRRARDVAVLLGGAHLGLPAGGVRNDATIPTAAFRQGHPWRLTLARAVPGPARIRAGTRLQAYRSPSWRLPCGQGDGAATAEPVATTPVPARAGPLALALSDHDGQPGGRMSIRAQPGDQGTVSTGCAAGDRCVTRTGLIAAAVTTAPPRSAGARVGFERNKAGRARYGLGGNRIHLGSSAVSAGGMASTHVAELRCHLVTAGQAPTPPRRLRVRVRLDRLNPSRPA
jgi:hypothetical protein